MKKIIILMIVILTIIVATSMVSANDLLRSSLASNLDYESWTECNISETSIYDFITAEYNSDNFYYSGILGVFDNQIKVFGGDCNIKDFVYVDGTIKSAIIPIGGLVENSEIYTPYYATVYDNSDGTGDYLAILKVDESNSKLKVVQNIFLSSDLGTVGGIVGGCLNNRNNSCAYNERVIGVVSLTNNIMYVADGSNNWSVYSNTAYYSPSAHYYNQIAYDDFDADGKMEFIIPYVYVGNSAQRTYLSTFEYNSTNQNFTEDFAFTYSQWDNTNPASIYSQSKVAPVQVCQIGDINSSMELCGDVGYYQGTSRYYKEWFVYNSNLGVKKDYDINSGISGSNNLGMMNSFTYDINNDGRIDYCSYVNPTTINCYDDSDYINPINYWTGIPLREGILSQSKIPFMTELDGNLSTMELLFNDGELWKLSSDNTSVNSTIKWEESNTINTRNVLKIADLNNDSKSELISISNDILTIYSMDLLETPVLDSSIPLNYLASGFSRYNVQKSIENNSNSYLMRGTSQYTGMNYTDSSWGYCNVTSGGASNDYILIDESINDFNYNGILTPYDDSVKLITGNCSVRDSLNIDGTTLSNVISVGSLYNNSGIYAPYYAVAYEKTSDGFDYLKIFMANVYESGSNLTTVSDILLGEDIGLVDGIVGGCKSVGNECAYSDRLYGVVSDTENSIYIIDGDIVVLNQTISNSLYTYTSTHHGNIIYDDIDSDNNNEFLIMWGTNEYVSSYGNVYFNAISFEYNETSQTIIPEIDYNLRVHHTLYHTMYRDVPTNFPEASLCQIGNVDSELEICVDQTYRYLNSEYYHRYSVYAIKNDNLVSLYNEQLTGKGLPYSFVIDINDDGRNEFCRPKTTYVDCFDYSDFTVGNYIQRYTGVSLPASTSTTGGLRLFSTEIDGDLSSKDIISSDGTVWNLYQNGTGVQGTDWDESNDATSLRYTVAGDINNDNKFDLVSMDLTDFRIYSLNLTGVTASSPLPPLISDCDLELTQDCEVQGNFNYNSNNKIINFTYANGSVTTNDITSGEDWISVDSNSILNVPSKITFLNLTYPASAYGIFKDGSYSLAQSSVSNIVNDGNNISFNVSGFSNYSLYPLCDSTLSISPCRIVDDMQLTVGSLSHKDVYMITEQNSNTYLNINDNNIFSHSNITIMDKNSDSSAPNIGLEPYAKLNNVTINIQEASNPSYLRSLRGDFTINNPNNLTVYGSISRDGSGVYGYGYFITTGSTNSNGIYKQGIMDLILYSGTYNLETEPKTVILGDDFIWLNESLTLGTYYIGNQYLKPNLQYVKSDMGISNSVTDFALYRNGVELIDGVDYQELVGISSFYKPEESFLIEPLINVTGNWSIVPNVEPIVDSVRISPLIPSPTDDLIGYCNASDTDGNNLTYYYEWYNGTTLYTQGSLSDQIEGSEILLNTLDSSNTKGAEDWTFSCLVNDGRLNSTWTNSTISISSAPIINSVVINPTIVSEFSGAEGVCNATDSDNVTFYYYHDWYLNGSLVESNTTLQGGVLTDTYDGNLSPDDVIKFVCFAGDGTYNATNEVNVSKTVFINTPPVHNLSYIAPTNDTGILNGYCTGYDANEDTLTFDYILYKNDVQFSLGSTGSGVSEVQKLVTSIDDDEDNLYLINGDEWILSCQVSDGINSTDYINSSVMTVTKNNVASEISEVVMYPIILINNSIISATANATDRNFDNLNYTFDLYESPINVQNVNVDNFTDGLIYSGVTYPGTETITGAEYPLWTYSAQPNRDYPTTITESNGELVFSVRLDSPVSYSLNGAYSQLNYEVKNNNLKKISFDYYLEHKTGGETSYIAIGDTIIKEWNNPIYSYQQESGHIDMYYNDTTKIVDLYINDIFQNSINISSQNNNYLNFFWDRGRVFYPNIYKISNLNITKDMPSGYSVVESLIVESPQGVEVSSGDFTYNPNASNVYKVGVITNDGELNSTEVFSLDFLARDVNNPPTSTASTYPEVFIGTDDDIEGYCLSNDQDGDTVEYLWKWYLNDVIVKSGNYTSEDYFKLPLNEEVLLDTLDSNVTSVEDTVIFSCASYDAVDVGDWNNATQYIWSENNFAPNTPVISIDSLNYNVSPQYPTNVSFTTTIVATDEDGDLIKYEWRFVKNEVLQTLITTDYMSQDSELYGNLNYTQTTAGDVWYIKARAFDGVSYSSWGQSNSIIIENTAPTITTVEITGAVTENSTLSANVVGDDTDGQDLITEYKWYNNDVETSLNTSTYPFGETQSGDELILSARVYDGIDYSEWLNSTPITILDSSNPVVLQSVTIESDGGLSGNCLATDEDGDALDFGYKWYKNGIEFDNGTSLSQLQGVKYTTSLVDTLAEGNQYIFSCSVNDTDGSVDYTNSSVFVIPEISFDYFVVSTDIDYIDVDWTSNADSVYVYKNGALVSISTLIGYKFEGLTPDTEYTIKLVPYKDGYFGSANEFNVTTEPTDNLPPYIQDVFITPSVAYTDDALTGTCNGNDVASPNLFYTYTWRVNDVVVDSGVTGLKTRDLNVVVGSITSSNYESGDNISLECIVNDGISSSNSSFDNITIQNTEPVLDVVIIEINGSNYECSNSYSDIDGDNQSVPIYSWILNGNTTSYNTSSVSNTIFDVDDELVCEIDTGDAYHNLSVSSSIFIVGDFVSPSVSDINVPVGSVYTDTSYTLSAKCVDNNNIGTGYPRIRFVNPNYEEEEYQLFYDGGDTYKRYLTFNIAGTYSNFEVECKDGNNNQDVLEYSQNLISLVRETVVNIGGGGSGEELPEQEEFRNITSFSVVPQTDSISLTRGSTRIVEFEVVNDDIIDIAFTTAIIVSPNDEETYDWMEFEGGLKAITFNIEKEGGLSTNNRYVRYYINVPEDADIGEHIGVIEINGLGQSEEYNITIDVQEGVFTNLLSFLNYEIFEVPFTQSSLTANSVADLGTFPSDEGRPFKVWHLLLTFGFIGGGIYLYYRYKP